MSSKKAGFFQRADTSARIPSSRARRGSDAGAAPFAPAGSGCIESENSCAPACAIAISSHCQSAESESCADGGRSVSSRNIDAASFFRDEAARRRAYQNAATHWFSAGWGMSDSSGRFGSLRSDPVNMAPNHAAPAAAAPLFAPLNARPASVIHARGADGDKIVSRRVPRAATAAA